MKEPNQHDLKFMSYILHVDPLPLSLPSAPAASSSQGIVEYPILNYDNCDKFLDSQRAFFAAITDWSAPTSCNEAVKNKRWRNSVSGEINALEASGTWDITVLPPGKKAIGCRWVFTIKYKSNGEIDRFKARLVAFGNKQEEGLDFDETFAPVVKIKIIQMFLKVVTVKGWEIHQMEVHNALLHGDLEEKVYMKLHPGFVVNDKTKVCKLKKALYGLRQAPRCWFSKLTAVLKGYAFIQNKTEHSVFTLVCGSMRLYVLIYVDDLLIGDNDSLAIVKFKGYISICFHMKDLGPMTYFLGIEVSRYPQDIYLSQRKYALDIVKECGLLGNKPISIPLEQNQKLAVDKDDFFNNPERYMRLVGRLVNLTFTHPKLSYAVDMLAQFMQYPRSKHWDAATLVVRYLKGCLGQGILLSADSDLQLAGYCDSDWVACPLTRRSLTYYIVMLDNSPIAWKTKKQPTVSWVSLHVN